MDFSIFEQYEDTTTELNDVNQPQQLESEKCNHENTCLDNGSVICTECGMIIEKVQTYEKEWRYYDCDNKKNPTRCLARKLDGIIIMKDLENTGIDHNIIKIANDIYVQVTKGQIKRGKSSRKAIIAACLFHAYNQSGTPKSCDMLRSILKDTKLEKAHFLHGMKYVAMNMPKSKIMHSSYITPKDIIKEIMIILNASSNHVDEAIKIYDQVENKSTVFNESRPQSVAAGIVYYYIKKTELKITTKEFIAKVKISELTINKICNEINRILAN